MDEVRERIEGQFQNMMNRLRQLGGAVLFEEFPAAVGDNHPFADLMEGVQVREDEVLRDILHDAPGTIGALRRGRLWHHPQRPRQEVMTMRLFQRAAALVLLLLVAAAVDAHAWSRSPARTFATLPAGTAHPEGLTVDAAGNVWIADFDVSKAAGPGDVIEFDPSGQLVRVLHPTGSSNLLLGLAFHPSTGKLLVIDFGHGQVLTVNPVTGAAAPFITLPTGTPPPPPPNAANSGLNDLTFDSAGNAYVSDSFQGIIWRTGPTGGLATPWVTNALLTTAGVPPFGANGLRFNKHETALFVANTGNDTVVKIPVVGGPPGTTGTPGTPAVFVNSVNGADGLIIDAEDNLWIAANQADEIVVLDPTGRVIAKLGDFNGINRDGAPRGLLFPASLAFSPNGHFLYVTNLSLDLRLVNPAFNAVDSQWAAQVRTHTVSKIRARIPPISGLPERDSDERDEDERDSN